MLDFFRNRGVDFSVTEDNFELYARLQRGLMNFSRSEDTQHSFFRAHGIQTLCGDYSGFLSFLSVCSK